MYISMAWRFFMKWKLDVHNASWWWILCLNPEPCRGRARVIFHDKHSTLEFKCHQRVSIQLLGFWWSDNGSRSSFLCSLFAYLYNSFVSINLCYFKMMYTFYALDGELGARDAGSRERSPSKEPKAVSDLHPFSVYGSVNTPYVGELIYVQQRHCLCKSFSRFSPHRLWYDRVVDGKAKHRWFW